MIALGIAPIGRRRAFPGCGPWFIWHGGSSFLKHGVWRLRSGAAGGGKAFKRLPASLFPDLSTDGQEQSGESPVGAECQLYRMHPTGARPRVPICQKLETVMSSIIYLVGLVVVVLAILSFIGLR